MNGCVGLASIAAFIGFGCGMSALALGGASHLEIAGLGLPVVEVAADGPIVAFTVDEFALGADLNGDGDTWDSVVHVHDATTGMVTNLQLTGTDVQVAGSTVAFKVSEREQGNRDLNGDGDTDDIVEFIYDATTRTTTNLRLATISSQDSNTTQDVVPFLVWEAAAETDLDGDGDTSDFVVHLYDTRTHVVTNLGLATRYPYLINAERTIIAMAVNEASQANSDLNGDGDTRDDVVFVYDMNSQVLTNLGIAQTPFDYALQVRGGNVVVSVSEGLQGHVDLNGDEDALDVVPFIYDTRTGTLDNFRVAGRLWISDSLGLLFVKESDQRNTDLNGDGDADDTVLFVLDTATHMLTNPGLAAAVGTFGLTSRLIAWAVPEEAQGGADLNGDGDATDLVVHVFDRSDQSITNTHLACSRLFAGSQIALTITASGSIAAFAVREFEQASTDLNGDGDANDEVVHLFDASTRTTQNLALAVGDIEVTIEIEGADDLLAFRVSEHAQGGTDLNGDGDTLDRVLFVYDTARGELLDTGLAMQTGPLASRGVVLAEVSERAQGAIDLDHDGDADDYHVLYAVSRRAGPPCSAGTIDYRNGAPVPVLRVNGASDTASVATGSPITVSLAASPSGPTSARYALWVWRAATERDVTVFAPNGSRCGCLVAPSPLHLGHHPQPLFCLNGGLPINAVCGGSHRLASPPRAPWSLTRATGLAHPITLVLQGVLQDLGSSASTVSATNAVVLSVQ
jgi:hypothetical protein